MSTTGDIESLIVKARGGAVPHTVLLRAVSQAGAWQELAEAPEVLDALDPEAVAVEVLRTRQDWHGLPAEIVAVVAARQVLGTLEPSQRRVARTAAMTRYAGAAVSPDDTDDGRRPVQWMRLRQDPPHLVLTGHRSHVSAVAAVPQPDGPPLLASGGGDWTVRLWDPITGTPRGTPIQERGRVTALRAVPLPGGPSLLAVAVEWCVRLWEPVTGALVGTLAGHLGRVSDLATVSLPDGRILLASAGEDDHTVRWWDPVEQATIGVLPTHDGVIRLVSWSTPDGRAVLAGLRRYGSMQVWDATTGEEIHPEEIRRDGGRVDQLVALQPPNGGTLLAVATPARPFSPDGRTIRLHEPAFGAEPGLGPVVRRLPVPDEPTTAMTALAGPSGQPILACADQVGLRLWNPADGAPIGILSGHQRRVVALAEVPLPEGRSLLASASWDSTVRVWDVSVSQPEAPDPTGPVRALTFLAGSGGRTVLAGAVAPDRVRMWNPDDGTEISELSGDGRPISDLVAMPAPDGGTLVAVGVEHGRDSHGSDSEVRLCDPITGAIAHRITMEAKAAWRLAPVPLPDGRVLLATASRDSIAAARHGAVRLWDPATGEPVGEPLPDSLGPIASLPRPDGGVLLATESDYGFVLFWDPLTGTRCGPPIASYPGLPRRLTALPVPDGRTLLAVAGGEEHGDPVLLWDPDTGVAVGPPLPGPAVAVVPLPDGGFLLASGASDGTVRLWDPATEACRYVLPLDSTVYALAAHGQQLAVGCRNGVLVVDTAALLAGAAAPSDAPGSSPPTPPARDPEAPAPGPPTSTADEQLGSPATAAVAGWLRPRWARLRSHPPHRVLSGHDGGVNLLVALALPAGRKLLASAGDDPTVRLWDPVTGAPHGDPLPQPGVVTGLAAVPLPDQTSLLAVAVVGSVRVWDPATNTVIDTLTGHPAAVTALAALPMPDGRMLLATGSAQPDSTIRLWDLHSGSVVRELLCYQDGLTRLVPWPQPDGHTLLVSVASSREPTRVWDPATGAEIIQYNGVKEATTLPRPGQPTLLAAVTWNDILVLWDPTPGVLADAPPNLGREQIRGTMVALPLPDQRTLLAAGGEESLVVKLRDPVTGDPPTMLTGHTDVVRALAPVPLPDGRTVLASGSADSTIRLWDPAIHPFPSAAQRAGPRHDPGPVRALAFLPQPDGRILLAGATRGSPRVLLWDAETGEPSGEVPPFGEFVETLAAVPLPDGRTVVAVGGGEQLVGDDHAVWLYDPVTRATTAPLLGHTYWVTDLVAMLLPDGRTALAVGCFSNEEPDPRFAPEYADDLRLWDPVTGAEIGTAPQAFTGTLAAIPLPDGRTVLATQGPDHALLLWDPVAGAATGDPLTGHASRVNAITAVSCQDGRTLLASGDEDGTVRLWDPLNGAVAPLTGHTQPITALAAVESAVGGTVLASGAGDGTVRLWDPATGACRHTLPVGSPVRAMAAHGPRLAVGCQSGVLVF